MRIVSGFHDYYDGAATIFGQEPLFIRKTNLPKEMWPKVQVYSKRNTWDFPREHPLDAAVIIFCRRIYDVEYEKEPHNYKLLKVRLVEPPDRDVVEMVNRFLKDYPNLSDEPIWTINFNWWEKCPYPRYITNPVLRDYHFERIIDPYTAAQELDMFLSNLAVRPDKAPDKIDDLTKIESHGFDKKLSFRKEKKK